MKDGRHEAICNIIRTNNIDTQAALAKKLRDCGYSVAQTTVSRDIKELKLVKVPSGNGSYKYMLPEGAASQTGEFADIFEKNILKVMRSESMIVVRTVPAAATQVARYIDLMSDRRVLGTVSGYDTLFIAVDSREHTKEVCEELKCYIMS